MDASSCAADPIGNGKWQKYETSIQLKKFGWCNCKLDKVMNVCTWGDVRMTVSLINQPIKEGRQGLEVQYFSTIPDFDVSADLFIFASNSWFLSVFSSILIFLSEHPIFFLLFNILNVPAR